MNKLIVDARDNMRRADDAYEAIVRSVILRCKHEHVAECDEMSPPWRVCLDCGLTDEGWGCGYQVLRNDAERVGRISRDRALELRTVSLWQCDNGESIESQIDRFFGAET